MQLDAIQMNATIGTQAHAVALNALAIPADTEDGAARYLCQPSHHMQFDHEAALKHDPTIVDQLFDKPGANRNKTPLSSKAPPFISTTVQDGWQPGLSDVLPSYVVEQLKISGSEDIVPPSVRKCWNMHDKVGPPGDLSLPVKGTRLPVHREEQEHCQECGMTFTADSAFCRNCGAKRHREDATAGCQTERWRHNLYDPGLWAMPPKGEIYSECAFDDPQMVRGRHTERQPHSHSCVSRTPSPLAVCHVHPLASDSIIKLPEMPFQQLRMQPPEEALQHSVEEWPQEGLAELPVKHTFIHYSTPSLEESDAEDTESSGGSTTASEKTLSRSSTAPSLMMLNPVFQTKSQDAAKKSTVLSEMQLLHAKKQCSPCAYFHQKADGCRRGDDCQFCHLCPASATKSKKKNKSREIHLRLLRLQSGRQAAKAGKGKNARPNWADMSS